MKAGDTLEASTAEGTPSSDEHVAYLSAFVPPQLLQPKKAQHKRRLVPSRRMALFLVMPFVVWGVILVAVTTAGFAELAGNDGPIASLGVLQTGGQAS